MLITSLKPFKGYYKISSSAVFLKSLSRKILTGRFIQSVWTTLPLVFHWRLFWGACAVSCCLESFGPSSLLSFTLIKLWTDWFIVLFFYSNPNRRVWGKSWVVLFYLTLVDVELNVASVSLRSIWVGWISLTVCFVSVIIVWFHYYD